MSRRHDLVVVALLGAFAAATAAFIPQGGSTVDAGAAPTIYVRNLSQYVTDAEVANVMPAFQAATTEDFAPVWGTDARLVVIPKDERPPRGAMRIDLLDRSPIRGALAYHGVRDGAPFSSIFVGTSRYYGYSWTVGFTHELWEMLADPSITRAAQGYTDDRIWAQEVADPVEADADGYRRPGADGKPVLISDFVTDKWFGALTVGPFDFAEHLQQPLTLRPGGYAQYWNGWSWVLVDNFRRGRHDDRFLLGEDIREAT